MHMFNLALSSVVLVTKSLNSNLIAAPSISWHTHKKKSVSCRGDQSLLLHVTHTEQRNAQPAWSLELLCTLSLDHTQQKVRSRSTIILDPTTTLCSFDNIS